MPQTMAGSPAGMATHQPGTFTTIRQVFHNGRTRVFLRPQQPAMHRTTGLLTNAVLCLLLSLMCLLNRTYSAAALPSTTGAPGTSSSSPPKRKWGGYNPAIHGSYDPNADYAREATKEEEEEEAAAEAAAAMAAGLPHPNAPSDYTAQAHFNRFTGKFQTAGQGPEMHNDENKSKRQMTAFFDVDAAANSHDGRSLKAERRGKSLNKKELKAFKDKRREKKEEKRRAWLRD